MSEFKQYRRKQIAELRPVTIDEIEYFRNNGILKTPRGHTIMISEVELANGSPKKGDMIARNPKNHDDQWLVAEQYFNDNFEPL